jgi:hypothetical protein
MNTISVRRVRRATAGLAMTAAALAGSVDPAWAAPNGLTVNGMGTWEVRPWGDAGVNAAGDVQLNGGGRGRDVSVFANVGADDKTLPAAGECEGAITDVTVWGPGLDFTMIGAGEVCGVHPQAPESIITHVFTGTFEVYDVEKGPRPLRGVDGFFEVRLAQDGTASVFAVDT